MGDPIHSSYKDMLIQLSELIDERSLEAMKFRCDGLIGSREREQIDSPFQLWNALEKRECLGISNLQFLKELLRSCMGRQLQAISLVENYEHLSVATTQGQGQYQTRAVNGQNGNAFQPYTPIQPPQVQFLTHNRNVLHNEMKYLSKSLGGDWCFFIRELDVPDSTIETIKIDYRYTREQIYQCLLVWQDLHKHDATKERLMQALRDVNRNDLVARMESGDY